MLCSPYQVVLSQEEAAADLGLHWNSSPKASEPTHWEASYKTHQSTSQLAPQTTHPNIRLSKAQLKQTLI